MRFGKLTYAWFEKGHIKVTDNYLGERGGEAKYLPVVELFLKILILSTLYHFLQETMSKKNKLDCV